MSNEKIDWTDPSRVASIGSMHPNEQAIGHLPRLDTTVPEERVRFQNFLMALILILAAGFVFVILPTALKNTDEERLINGAEQSTQTMIPSQEEQKSSLEIARNKMALNQAGEITEEFLRRFLDLEDQGLRFWNAAAVDEINKEAARADALFRRSEGQPALEAYSLLLEKVANLESSRPDVIQTLKVEASNALNREDYTDARERYRILELLQPDSREIPALIARTEKIPEIKKLLQESSTLIQQGEYARAKVILEEAQAKLPDWPKTLQMTDEVEAILARKAFESLMSEGFTAMKMTDFVLAEALFKQAKLSPFNNGDAEEGLIQLVANRTNHDIQRLIKETTISMSEGSWKKALEFLERIDSISPLTADLSATRYLAEERLRIETSGEELLSNPLALQSDDRLSSAKKWIIEASKLKDPKGSIDKQLLELGKYVTLARTRHKISITSDNLTNIQLLRAGPSGRLGALEESSLALIPGQYTLVGKRTGYVDVRVDFEVPFEAHSISLDIRCLEKI